MFHLILCIYENCQELGRECRVSDFLIRSTDAALPNHKLSCRKTDSEKDDVTSLKNSTELPVCDISINIVKHLTIRPSPGSQYINL